MTSLEYREPKAKVEMIGDMAFVPSYTKSSDELDYPAEVLLEELLAAGIITRDNWRDAAKPITLFVARAMKELAESIAKSAVHNAETICDELTPSFQGVSRKWLEKMGEKIPMNAD